MRHVAFVVPYVFETSLRFLRATAALPDVRVSLVTTEPAERFEPDLRALLAGHWRVDDALEPRALAEAVEGLSRQLGPVERLIGVLEQLQVPLAAARERLGLPGLGVEAARNFRDKARMKEVLSAADLPCARHVLATDAARVQAFTAEVGFPVVVKPPAGAGAVSTFRLDGPDDLRQALSTFPPSPARPTLVEEFVVGEEHSFDAVCVDGRVVWHSISRYRPGPLEVLRRDWIQWCVLLPRSIDGPEYEPIRRAGSAALAALGLRTGMAHMEWFRRPDGSVAISEVGARPPGAQFTSLMSWAHDRDLYSSWARLAVFDAFDPPVRRWAVGAAYLRGQGHGRVARVLGLDQAQRELGSLVVEAHLPRPGQAKASSYEGEGFVVLRHADTGVVEAGLRRLLELVRVELS